MPTRCRVRAPAPQVGAWDARVGRMLDAVVHGSHRTAARRPSRGSAALFDGSLVRATHNAGRTASRSDPDRSVVCTGRTTRHPGVRGRPHHASDLEHLRLQGTGDSRLQAPVDGAHRHDLHDVRADRFDQRRP